MTKEAADDTTGSSPAAGTSHGVMTTEVDAAGWGATHELAIRDALVRAVEQVHGRALAISTVSADLGNVVIESRTKSGSADKSGSDRVTVTLGGVRLMEATRGIVARITILEERKQDDHWSVRLRALVASYSAPNEESMRILVAVEDGEAGLRRETIRSIRDGIGKILHRTGRVTLIDRDASETVENERQMVHRQDAPLVELVKAGQVWSADVVAIVRVEDLTVKRSGRKMRTTNREIVNYRGSGRLTFRLVHVATSQVLGSGQATATRTKAESLSDSDTGGWTESMLEEMVDVVSRDVAGSLFPIRVIDQAGVDVTINAGEGRLVRGTYRAVILGGPIRDPETGVALARRERQCCSVKVNLVTDRLAFGTLEVAPTLADGEVLEVRELLKEP